MDLNLLYNVLEQQLEIYTDFYELELRKFEAMSENSISKLDGVVGEEQALHMKLRGLDQKREKLTDNMSNENSTFKKIISGISDSRQKQSFQELYDKLYAMLNNVRDQNSRCMTIAEVRLHKIKMSLEQLGETEKKTMYNESGSKRDVTATNLSKKI